jgi:hypothetical protein
MSDLQDTNANDRVDARVAFVLSDREVLLDKGKDDGVELGMRFVILGTTDVKNSAGVRFNVSYPKGIVKIVRFENAEQNAVGRTFKTIKGRPPISSLAAFATSWNAGTPDRVATIRTETADTLRDRLAPEDYNVDEGDLVRETRGDEYED